MREKVCADCKVDCEVDREVDREVDCEVDREVDREVDCEVDCEVDREVNREVDREVDREVRWSAGISCSGRVMSECSDVMTSPGEAQVEVTETVKEVKELKEVKEQVVGRQYSVMTASSLARRLDVTEAGRGPLVLDCRPFLAYARRHVLTAHSVHCPQLLRRRHQRRRDSTGRTTSSLRHVVTSPSVRERLLTGQYRDVVLYDDLGSTQSSLTSDTDLSTLGLALRTLHDDDRVPRNVRFFVLQGGFQHFTSGHPEMCVVNSQQPSPLSSGAKHRSTSNCLQVSCWAPGTASLDNTYSTGQPVELLPHLYLGSASHAKQMDLLKSLGITALLNVSRTCPNSHPDVFTYKTIPVDDTGTADIGQWFGHALSFIDSIQESGGKVLVHCQAGVSRSATICLAYLIAKCRLQLDQAFDYVRLRRRVISPNFNFMGQLVAWERECLGTSPTTSPSTSPVTAPPGHHPTADHPLPATPVVVTQPSTADVKLVVATTLAVTTTPVTPVVQTPPTPQRPKRFLFDFPPATPPALSPNINSCLSPHYSAAPLLTPT